MNKVDFFQQNSSIDSAGPMILLYNFAQDHRREATLQYLSHSGISTRVVQTPEFLHSLGYLFGIPGFEPCPLFNLSHNFQEEMIVMKGFSHPQLNAFLQFFHENHLKPIDLKAMLTPITINWNSIQLHNELQKEHEALKR